MYNSIIILGPTASGKTDISIKIAKALNTEIINADSMQIYKELNIGTAKASVAEQEGIKHHLLDFVDPTKEFSVSEYKNLAMPIITNLINNKKVPIIVGGTGFYVQSLLTNFEYGNSYKNEQLRAELTEIANEKGNQAVHDILKQIDIDSANKIHYNDLKKVIRAIEIFKMSNKKKSELNNTMQTNTQSVLKPLIIALNWNRETLYERINFRVDSMIKNGLINEVKNLVNKYNLTINNQSMQGIGYKEILSFLNNECSQTEAIEKIKISTRHYAKRQITWFKNQLNATWFNLSEVTTTDVIKFVLSNFNNWK